MTQSRSGEGFALVADIPIDAVRSTTAGFVLEGRGADRDDYRLELHFDFPVDAKTRKVLGELMSQAEVTVSRRPAAKPGA
jgi:hypothetical protein